MYRDCESSFWTVKGSRDAASGLPQDCFGGWPSVSSSRKDTARRVYARRDYAGLSQVRSTNADTSIFDEVTWTPRTISAVIITFTVSALANAGGVGGGGFLVPLFNLVLGVSLKEAMGLSQASITGGALAAGALAIFSSHPKDKSKPLIDMNVALLFLPCLLIGVTLGVTLNQIFPDWTLLIIISTLLGIMCFKSLKTAIKMHRAEVAARQNRELAPSADLLPPTSSEIPHFLTNSPQQSLTRNAISLDLDAHAETSQVYRNVQQAHPNRNFGSLPNHFNSISGPQSPWSEVSVRDPRPPWPSERLEQAQQAARDLAGNRAKQKVEKGEERLKAGQTPFREYSEQPERSEKQSPTEIWAQVGKLLVALLIWTAFLFLQILKSQFQRCTSIYLAMYGVQIGFGLICVCLAAFFWWWSHRQLGNSDLEQPLVHTDEDESASKRPSLKQVFFSALAICLGAGLSALCGLGGGMILGPIMLDLGLHPLVAASTSLLLVGASSSTATIQFALGDRLLYGWGIIVFSVCVVASLIGVAGFGRIVRRSGRASLIVFLLFFMMASGGIMTLGFGIVNTIDSLKHGGQNGFLNLCSL